MIRFTIFLISVILISACESSVENQNQSLKNSDFVNDSIVDPTSVNEQNVESKEDSLTEKQ